MAVAFVLGNGQSRQGIDLHSLNKLGKIYGCNALYRDYTPDVLIAVDKAISEQIQNSGYSQTHRFYTRRPIDGLKARRIPEQYWGFSSGQVAVALAAMDRSNPVYMLGFDLGSSGDKFNNVYADTEFYKRSIDRVTFSGNWIKQTVQIARDYPDVTFIRVVGSSTATITEFDTINNIQHISLAEFCGTFGI